MNLLPSDVNVSVVEDPDLAQGKNQCLEIISSSSKSHAPSSVAFVSTTSLKSTFSSNIRTLKTPPVQSTVTPLLANLAYAQFPNDDDVLGVPLRYLVLYIKDLGEHLSIEVDVTTQTGAVKTLVANTKQSEPKMSKNAMSIPLQLNGGWNVVVLDMMSLTSSCMDNVSNTQHPSRKSDNCPSEYAYANRVYIHSTCRLSHAYFTDELKRHSDLPEILKAQFKQ